MKWFILLALLSCSNRPSAKSAEAKPVSPLTVKPCFCMKMFQPVCAEGSNYSNSCEAECHGHKKWTMGNCKTQSKK